MKKRLLYALAAVVATVGIFTSCEKNDEMTIGFDALPSVAQTTITTHFDKDDIILITYEKEFLNHEYAVIFVDGTAIEFEKNGTWESLDSQVAGVPMSILPTAIAEFITSKYPDSKVTEISRIARLVLGLREGS